MIVLPISFLTGDFGTNFNSMADRNGSGRVFLPLGLLPPLACVGVTVVWLKRRGEL
jgi:Mg2+ and Co2+ transporter CorA